MRLGWPVSLNPTDLPAHPIQRAPSPLTLVPEPAFGAWGHDEHVHDFHQFVYTPIGHAVVWAHQRTFHLCGSVALWTPAGVAHAAQFDEDCLVHSIAFDPDAVDLPFTACTEVPVPTRRRRAILAYLRADEDPDAALFAELTGSVDLVPLPEPRSAAPLAVAAGLRAAPNDQRTAAQWAASMFTSPTTLRRAFVTETGLTFSEWRTRLRLNVSIDLLADGLMVSTVAQRVGFTSTNGFIMAFRRHLDQTPKAYMTARLIA